MILYVKGDLLHSPAQVLVNTVNTVGVMGKGVALQFKQLFPDMFDEYRDLCESGKFDIGNLWLYKSPNKWVLNFPTKRHWRQPSRIEYIEAGLRKFVDTYSQMQISSIAFPPLGCGNGQLDFESEVQPLMQRYLKPLPIEVFVYPNRHSDFVEHQSQKEMKQWLRSEPDLLPFSEVWDDLRDVLDRQDTFDTVAKGATFRARMVDSPPEIVVTAGKTVRRFPYDLLLMFWQQLRSHGYTMRHIASGIDRNLSYLIPIFAQLEYVTPVHVADEYDNLESTSVTGLQILPPAFRSRVSPDDLFEQLALL